MKYGPIVIQGQVCSKSNAYRIITLGGHGALAKTDACKEYERSFYIQCPIRDKRIKGYFKLYIDFYFRSQRSDLDGGCKLFIDCLQQCKVIENDNKCTEIHLRKFLDKDNPRVEFTIEEVEL